MTSPPETLLELRAITKSFTNVLANNRVSLDVARGEIHALLGENGAGKTTLMNVLYGLYPADSGDIYWKGQRVEIKAPRVALDLGIGMIHQHFMLIPKFTVVENIILGRGRSPALDLDGPAQRIRALSEAYGLQVDPWAKVQTLSVGTQQRVEIVKALYRGAELLIMDEPTSVLTPGEVEHLYAVLDQLRSENRSVVFISHKLNEVLRVSDRISVLRDGRLVGTVNNTPDLSRAQLANMMVGRLVTLQIDKAPARRGQPVLRLQNLRSADKLRRGNLNGLSLEVHQGEIVGIAGVDGNGQAALTAALIGLHPLAEGRIELLGQDVTEWDTAKIRRLPLAYIPEERQQVGLVMGFPVCDNLLLSDVDRPPFGQWWALSQPEMLRHARALIERFRIATSSPLTLVDKLSGGNQQKVVIAREVGEEVDLIVAAQPTRGLDVDATRFVMDNMLAARQRGAGVLYISTDLEEILALSDTVGVMYEGRIVGLLPAAEASLETIGLWMAGEPAAEAAA